MNRKTINKILSQKHEDFLSSITDPEIKKLIDKNSIITGGSIVSLLLNERVKDFDYYFTDKETCKRVAEYFVNKFNEAHKDRTYLTTTMLNEPVVVEENDRIKIIVPSAGVASENDIESKYQYFESLPDEANEQYVDEVVKDIIQEGVEESDEVDSTPMEEIDKEKGKYRVVFMSSNAITLSNKIQLVIRFYGSPDEVHKNYDFVHCQNYWTSKDRKLILLPDALECILTKQLHYQGSLYPVCSVIRTRKFLKQGWYINAGQYLKMCFQISELNLNDINILEDQLTGVDAAYFFQIIAYCRERQKEDSEFKITTPYLVTIIDKIFG